MKTCVPCFPHRFGLTFTSVVCALVVLLSARPSQAADTLAYSFETLDGPFADGFVPNGGAYSQDTIGATEGTHSLKVSINTADTFVGTYSFNINPTPGGAIIGDPPGIDHVVFDLTVAAGAEFAGAFAHMGVIVFGMDQAGNFGFQRQFLDEENILLPAGPHTDLRINLTGSHGSGGSFNDIYGEQGSGSPLIPTAFEFFFNKSNEAPLTVYIDNVRVGMTPPVAGDYNGNGVVDSADYVLWRNNVPPLQNEVADLGTISPADYTAWRARFGNTSGSGSGLNDATVPEPGSGLLLIGAGMFWWIRKRGRTEM